MKVKNIFKSFLKFCCEEKSSETSKKTKRISIVVKSKVSFNPAVDQVEWERNPRVSGESCWLSVLSSYSGDETSKLIFSISIKMSITNKLCLMFAAAVEVKLQ